MRMTPKPKQPEKPTIVEKTEKQYILISPDGQVKALPL
jgi:hypothetical protein